MPMSNYDRLFGGKSGSAAKARNAMRKKYGPDEGDRVFYATVNRRRKQRKESGRGSGLREVVGGARTGRHG